MTDDPTAGGPTDEARGPTLGLDLGGTKFAITLVDSGGKVERSTRRPTRADRGPDAVIEAVLECIEEEFGDRLDAVTGAGVGVAGQVDDETGAVRFAPNLDWHDVALGERLRQALRVPVSVMNDVRAATVGEWLHGAGQGVDDLVCVFVGTGIGGGVVSGGELLRGHGNAAGEVGHTTIVVDGRPCRCRNRGCWEAYAGGWGIAERARERVRDDPEAGRPLLQAAGAFDEITAATVDRGFHDGDPLARELVHETATYLGAGLVSLVNVLDPATILLGGGVVEGIPELVERAADHVRTHALEAALQGLRIESAALGSDAVTIGAAAAARSEKLRREPGSL